MIPESSTSRIPGRGLMNIRSYQARIEFLRTLDIDLEPVLSTDLTVDQVKNNIESFVGTVEIPIGIVGPLLLNHADGRQEQLMGAVGTTEGALVASMSRGAKAVNASGGLTASVLYQRMVRTPMFIFATLHEAIIFESWVRSHFQEIRKVTMDHSNHAELIEIKPCVIGKIVHLKCIYTTGDASGQNMTTTCTWHACLWMEQQFNASHAFPILYFVIDGNGASDKKVSYYSMQCGRGVHVVCECNLTEEAIARDLKTTADDIFRSYVHSMAITRMDGMMGYNINVANTVAGFFAATAQDLACIHESSTGILQLERTASGLYVSLSLPNLVIGTVGGGTHLPAQRALLKMMGCCGKGGVERLAKIIAGFALSLEISTVAAIVSGQFARAHQELGRNKPVNWLLRSEVTSEYVAKHLRNLTLTDTAEIRMGGDLDMDNGALTGLTSRVSRKVIGFIQFEVATGGVTKKMLIKSKPLDEEVIMGLHYMANAISPLLAASLLEHQSCLEFAGSHHREIAVYEYLSRVQCRNIPGFFGAHIDAGREIYALLLERLQPADCLLLNSENEPRLWTDSIICKAIERIADIHRSYFLCPEPLLQLPVFDGQCAMPFYMALNTVNRDEYEEFDDLFAGLAGTMARWQREYPARRTPLTMVHNDYNPRNIAILSDGTPIIYDWELAQLNIPQRDTVELLSFVLPDGFLKDDLLRYARIHYELFCSGIVFDLPFECWLADMLTAAWEYMFSRVSLYLAGSLLMDYPFAKRVFMNTARIISFLSSTDAL